MTNLNDLVKSEAAVIAAIEAATSALQGIAGQRLADALSRYEEAASAALRRLKASIPALDLAAEKVSKCAEDVAKKITARYGGNVQAQEESIPFPSLSHNKGGISETHETQQGNGVVAGGNGHAPANRVAALVTPTEQTSAGTIGYEGEKAGHEWTAGVWEHVPAEVKKDLSKACDEACHAEPQPAFEAQPIDQHDIVGTENVKHVVAVLCGGHDLEPMPAAAMTDAEYISEVKETLLPVKKGKRRKKAE